MLTVAVLLGLFSLTGCTDSEEKSASASSQKNGGQAQQRPATPVNIITIEPQVISMTNELPGRVTAFMTAEIRPQVSGIIQSRLYTGGSLVEKDQQLYQIDPSRYEAAYQSAEANLQNAEAEVNVADALQNRYQSLIEINAISEQEFDNAKASLAQAQAAVALAQAELETAKINLDYTKVYAPISGYIGPSTVTVGALVTAQQEAALATIRQLDPVYVDLSQSAEEAQHLQEKLMTKRMTEGDDAQFEVSILLGANGNTYPEKGVMYATDLAVDENTGTIQLRSIFPNPNAILLPGMFVRATIEEAGIQKTIIVPQKAVTIETDGSKSVWIVDGNNTANKRTVMTSTSYENNWVISSGLKSGDRVIVEGTMMLQPGAKVDPTTIQNTQPNSSKGSPADSDSEDEPASEGASNNRTSSNE
jgi:membrane fusion protein (multidrug efflux system)